MHIIVPGGAGAMGRVTVRTLTEYEDVDQITIADYNEEQARELAFALKSSKIQVQQIDVNDEERLRSLLRGSDVVLSAVDYVYNLPVLQACIAGHMLANGEITQRGAFGPELCVPVESFFQELARYDMHVTETRTVVVS
ncbi:MAG: saccharopine dehydrogenase NADP-binding domain-containing protein [Ktedonobacteraceae bacterium]